MSCVRFQINSNFKHQLSGLEKSSLVCILYMIIVINRVIVANLLSFCQHRLNVLSIFLRLSYA